MNRKTLHLSHEYSEYLQSIMSITNMIQKSSRIKKKKSSNKMWNALDKSVVTHAVHSKTSNYVSSSSVSVLAHVELCHIYTEVAGSLPKVRHLRI